MTVRDIVRKAWQVTQVHLKKLIWYGAVPAFFSTVVSSVYLGYQYHAFTTSTLFTHKDPSLGDTATVVWGLISTYPKLTVALVIVAAVIMAGYTVLPPIFHAALIHAIMRIKNYEPISGSFEVGLRRFFPMFEYSVISGSFSVITVFTESSFVLRWWGEKVFFFILPIFLLIAMVGLIASFLFTYAEFFIVVDDKRVIKSIGESVILVLANLRKTILVFILMLLISARVILNVILVLLIPMGIVALAGYLASVFVSTVGIVLIAIFGVAALMVTSYLMGLFNVFSTAVWVFTYVLLAHKESAPIKDVDIAHG
ncbi:hypothetical protein HZA44_00940 [Candidatus Peregrinibacteria bacterium]|nr:hypothetical protein [Candidatus Peregrinibacteria bacterium]